MPDVEMYVTDLAQDPDEQRWVPDSDIAGMQKTDDPNDEWQEREAIRNAGGAIEFLHTLVDTVENFLELDTPVPAKRSKLDPMRTRELGSDKVRMGRRLIDSTPDWIVRESKERRKVTLVNYGPNVVSIGGLNIVSGAPNTFELPVSSATFWAPVTLSTTDDVYGVCAAAASATVHIIEEFDMES